MAIWVDEHAGQGGGGGGSTPSKVSWGDIENKPKTFKPEDHTHTIENIEDLSYQLDGKVNKKDGYNLSQENYTLEEKLKLENIPLEITKGFVSAVNGKQGEVILDKNTVGLDLVDNMQQASKTEFIELETKVTTIEEEIEKIPTEFVTTVNGESGEVTVNKETLGLSNVIDEKQATKDEFDSYKTSNDTELIAIKEAVNTNKESIDNLNERVDNLPTMPEEVVTSVNEKTGAVTLTKVDVGLSYVDNVKQVSETDFNLHKNNSAIHVSEQEKIDIGKIQAIETSLNGKADLDALNSHTSNTALHMSSSDRSRWDNKVDSSPNKQLSTNDFTDEYKTKIETNSTEIEAIKELLGNELPKEVQANRGSSLEQPNLKNIIISTTEPEEKYEGLIWIKPLVEEG